MAIYLQICNARGYWITCPEPYPSYHEAILAGQSIAPRNFMVDTGSRVPSRAEQLLFDPKSPSVDAELPPRRRKKTDRFLDEL